MKKTYKAPKARIIELECENIMDAFVGSIVAGGPNDTMPTNTNPEDEYQTGGFVGSYRTTLWGED